jgi:F0F1-type ATP synthase assembly protein I
VAGGGQSGAQPIGVFVAHQMAVAALGIGFCLCGGQRSLAAAFAWLQWLLPVLVFALAAWLGRARRFDTLGRPA